MALLYRAGNSKKTTQTQLFMRYVFFNSCFCTFQPFYRSYDIERFSLDCRKTKTKVNTLANQRA